MEVCLGYNNPEVFNCARLEFLAIVYYLFIFELAARPLKKDRSQNTELERRPKYKAKMFQPFVWGLCKWVWGYEKINNNKRFLNKQEAKLNSKFSM